VSGFLNATVKRINDRYRGVGEMNLEYAAGCGHFENL
jgi:hypothetical protein